jgi:FkbM family methyltransferase
MRVACIAIVRDEERDIIEWLSYHKHIGIDHFVIYENGSRDRTVRNIMAFAALNSLDLVHWPSHPGQLTAYADAAKRLAGQFDWCCFIDIDEFIALYDHQDVKELLGDFSAYDGLVLHARVFGSSGHVIRPQGLVIENYTKRAPDDFKGHIWVKSFVRPEKVLSIPNPHGFLIDGVYVNTRKEVTRVEGDGSVTASPIVHKVAAFHHYWCKSLEDYIAKRRRGSATGTQKKTLHSYIAHDNNDCDDASLLPWATRIREEVVALHRHVQMRSYLDPNSGVAGTAYFDSVINPAVRVVDNANTRSPLARELRFNRHFNYETLVQQIYESWIRPGDLVIDGGAHLGRHTIPMAVAVTEAGHVLAVEPIEEYGSYLRSRLERLSLPNVTLIASALDRRVGKTEINFVANSGGYTSILNRALPFEAEIEKRPVDCTTIDNVLMKAKNGHPDRTLSLIKLDLMGYEYFAFAGALEVLRFFRPLVVFEHHGLVTLDDAGLSSNHFLDLMSEIDYDLVDLAGNDARHTLDSPDPAYRMLVAYHRSDASAAVMLREISENCFAAFNSLHPPQDMDEPERMLASQ